MQLVETEQAQDSFEFGEIMHIRPFTDGRPMLRAMQADGRLQKVPTDIVIMTPTPDAGIPLDQLNLLIAEQKNCTVDELCNFVAGAKESKASEVKEVAKVTETPAPETAHRAPTFAGPAQGQTRRPRVGPGTVGTIAAFLNSPREPL
jgi:hypothetical protein